MRNLLEQHSEECCDFILAGPFIVTEEVWTLAGNMGAIHTAIANLLVFGIGYGALFKADRGRDEEDENDLLGIPLRFISLLLVTYGSVIILAFLFTAPETFGYGTLTDWYTVLRATSVAAIFSVVGAATADSVF